MIVSSAKVSQIGSGVTSIPLSSKAATILVITGVAAVLIGTQSLLAALTVVAAGLFCAFLMIAPLFWLAILLVVLIPFQGLISSLMGGYGSAARQVFAVWKEVLLLIGIFRAFRSNQSRRQIMIANRWVLLWSGFLVLTYCVAFLRTPSVPAFLSLDLETRFLGVMLFFMFLRLDEIRTARLLRLMLWSAGLLAIYGIIQYFWDYERLLPLVTSTDAFDVGQRRLYSYSLNPFEPAYGAVIAILILCSGAIRCGMWSALRWFTLLASCLILTYTRSAYLGLLAGVVALCIIDRSHTRRMVPVAVVATGLICGIYLFGGNAISNSSLGQKLKSIASLNDESSLVHKDRMRTAIQVIHANPFGIGLGKYGNVEARYLDGTGTEYTENWTLQVVIGAGVVAGFAFLGLTATILLSLFRLRCREAHSAAMVTAGATVFTAMTIAGMMIPVWDFLLPTVYAWALVGMALAGSRLYETDYRISLLRRHQEHPRYSRHADACSGQTS